MSWGEGRAAARARVNSGAYKQKKGIFDGEGFAAATDIIASKWLKDAADEKEEAKLKAKEERDERKRLRAAQTAQEAKDKKLQANAVILAENFTGDSSNTKAVSYFMNQLRLNDGNVGSVESSTQTRIDNGQLEFTPPVTERGEAQGPNIPADPKLVDLGMSVNKDGTTTLPFDPYDDEGKLTGEARPDPDRAFMSRNGGEDVRRSDLPTLKKVGWTEAAQMEQVFSDRGTPIEGTTGTGPKTVTTEGGVKITPYSKKEEPIDISGIKTYQDWQSFGTNLAANPQEYTEVWKDG